MKDYIFRAYDIRGKVGSELDIDQVYRLGQAIAFYFSQQKPVKTIALGMDGRIHSQEIKELLARALIDSGFDVVFIGLCSTPILYFALHQLEVDGGIMITASHNPGEYNGFKICLGYESVWGAQIQEILGCYRQGKTIKPSKKGIYREYTLVDEYTDWLVEHFAHLQGMQLPIIFDCGNGAAGVVMPQLIQKMGWTHTQLMYAEVDGAYPHHEADPIVPANMRDLQKAVADKQACFGIGFDGDADRMAPITAQGYLVPGDQLLALFAYQIAQVHPGLAIVSDINASNALIEFVQQLGSTLHLSPCGHALVKNQMKKSGALLGGELSCHFIFADRYFDYDDGIYAAMRLIELIIQSGKSLEQLLHMYQTKESSPGIRIACKEEEKEIIVQAARKAFESRGDVQLILIDGVRVQFSYGWGIIRVSNTQPMVSFRFEADTQQNLQRVKKDFYHVLLPYFDAVQLRDYLDLKEVA